MMNDLKELFKLDVQVVCTAEDVLRFGHSHHWHFELMEEKGVLTEPVQKGNWNFEELRDFTTLPGFAKERLAKVQEAGFPIYQIIFGDEIEVDPHTKPKEILTPEIDWNKVGKFTIAAIGAIALGAVYVMVSSVTVAMAVVDPKLIVVLDDGSSPEAMPWVCLVSWAK
jgi:hypothetical protein